LAPSSPGSAGSTSVSPAPDSGTPSSARPIPTAAGSSPATGPASRSFALCVKLAQTGANGRGLAEDETHGLQATAANRLAIWTSSSAVSRARTSPSPASAPGWRAHEAGSSSSSPASLPLFSPLGAGCSLRTYPDCFPQTVAEISPSFSRRWPTSGFTTSRGESWTADTSTCPSGGGASTSLADVLEASVPPRYCLSPRAAAGILRRAARRGKTLPGALRAALASLARTSEPKPDSPIMPDNSPEVAASQDRAIPPSSVRRLTPTECERLQGLPDGWTRPTGPPMAPAMPPAAMPSPCPSPNGSAGGFCDA
jgi:hypothetical protein